MEDAAARAFFSKLFTKYLYEGRRHFRARPEKKSFVPATTASASGVKGTLSQLKYRVFMIIARTYFKLRYYLEFGRNYRQK